MWRDLILSGCIVVSDHHDRLQTPLIFKTYNYNALSVTEFPDLSFESSELLTELL